MVTSEYMYIDENLVARVGEWVGEWDAALAAGVDYLDAIEHDGDYAYYAPETGEWYAVLEEAVAELGAAVLDGRGGDAYSLWCSTWESAPLPASPQEEG